MLSHPLTGQAAASVHSLDLQNHGGIALIYRSDFTIVQHSLDIVPTTFELLCVTVTAGSESLLLLGVYRPGSQGVTAQFFDELTSVLEQVSVQRRPFIICGDLNIHVDDANDAHAIRLVDLLQTFDCVQHVSEPTHLAGHTLDVVISHADTDINQLSVGSFVSDHALITFKFSLRRAPAAAAADVQRRKWRNYVAADFEADLAASRLCVDLGSLASYSPDELASLYENEMTLLLDKHCPKVTVKRKQSKLTP